MTTLPTDSIIIGKRYRKDLGDIKSLAKRKLQESMYEEWSGLIELPGDSGRGYIATSHFFFKDWDSTPAAHVNRYGILFLSTPPGDRAKKQRGLKGLARQKARKRWIGDEKKLENQIAANLTEAKVAFERQKKCRYGIIDIFIGGSPPSIIELKADSSQSSIRQAIGQLAFYSSEYPGAQLYIGVPGGIDYETRVVLNKWRIHEWK